MWGWGWRKIKAMGSGLEAVHGGMCMEGQYDPLGTELWREGKKKKKERKKTIKPNTKHFKNGFYDL